MSETRAVFGEDLVVEILLTLPSKSLTRFKCVSKGWYALINSPWFIAKHLNSKNSNLKNLLVMKNTFKNGKDENGGVEVAFSLLNLCNNDDESIEGGEDRIIVSSVEDLELPLSLKVLTRGYRGYVMGHCNGIICLYLGRWVLWNPAIQDYKLLPPSPNVSFCEPLGIQGFGYDAKLNEYKLVSISIGPFTGQMSDADSNLIINRPKASIYSLSSDSWKQININSLETETTFFRPDCFQIQFKEMLYWFGDECRKDLHVLSESFLIIKPVIISLDIQNEVFFDIMLPERIYRRLIPQRMTLRVWNGSLALFVLVHDHSIGDIDYLNRSFEEYFAIWVMDELGGPTGASWTKHVTLEPTEKPLGFLNSDNIILGDFMGLVCSYDLGTKRSEEENFMQNSPCTDTLPSSRFDSEIGYVENSSMSATAYVRSIVTVSGAHKLAIRDNSSVANLNPLSYSASSLSVADREWYSYSIWVIPPNDASLRIKRVLESLRTEFGGPQIEPHIPIVVSICMTNEDVLDKFRSLPLQKYRPFQAKFNQVKSSNFYYQCVSLLIDTEDEAFRQFDHIIGISAHFGTYGLSDVHMPRLSLLYGNLSEEERKVAVEKVSILDESISSLSFTVTQLALYKINYRDTTLRSWEKIAECNLPLP